MKDPINIQEYLALGAMAGQEDWDDDDELLEFDDDDDDEGFEDFDDDDDEDFEAYDGEDWDDDDELFSGFADYDDDDDDESFPERRRGRRRRRRGRLFKRPRYRRNRRSRRRLKRVRGSRGTTLKTKRGRSLKVRFGKSYATTVEVNKLIKDTERKFAAAVKERKANHAELTKRISKFAAKIDGDIASVRKSLKKVEDQAKTNALLGLVNTPNIKSINISEPFQEDADLAATAKFESNSLGLILALSGGLSGSSGGMDPLVMAIALGGLGK
ncbi:MAG: hypothetical protein AAFY31_00445 [Pseudomonadota bacterium]